MGKLSELDLHKETEDVEDTEDTEDTLGLSDIDFGYTYDELKILEDTNW